MPTPRRNQKLLRDMRRYLRRRRTVAEIALRFGLQPRTVYRYLNHLRDSGVTLVSSKDRTWTPPQINYQEQK